MSRSVQRWERQRAAWLTGHSSAHGGPLSVSTTMRRNAAILERSARRGERSGAGITATAVQDEIPAGLWHRLTHAHDGGRHHRPRWALAALAVGVFAGPGLLLGHGAYRALWRKSPSIGRLWWWPWAAVSGVIALVLVVLGVGFRPGLHFDRRFPLSLVDPFPLVGLIGWQLVVAGLVVAAQVELWGWYGVPAKAVGEPLKNKDGSFREIREDQKVALDPWKGAEPPAPQDAPEPETAYEKWEVAKSFEDDLAAIHGAPPETPDEGAQVQPTLAERLGDEIGFDPDDDVNDYEKES